MTGKRNHRLKSLPLANYSSALAKAVDWLGDRYLLAISIKSANRSATDQAAPGSNASAPTLDVESIDNLKQVADSRTNNFTAKRSVL
jgi:hypothetical protein